MSAFRDPTPSVAREQAQSMPGEISFATVITPRRGWAPLELGALWRCRGLLYFLVWRDVKVRYKQTVLGAVWAILQPLLAMVLFTVIFGHFARIPSEGVPYPIFSYCGLLPWTFFAGALGGASNSLIANTNLISKVYFPRVVVPVAACLAGLLDLAIASVVLLGLMAFYRVAPSPAVVTLPLFVLLALAVALAAGILLSALNVEYRDVRHAVPFLTQLWFYATPIAYPSGLITGPLRVAFALNPMAGVVEGFRWAVLGRGDLDGVSLAVSIAATALVLIGGLFYFHRVERRFADVV